MKICAILKKTLLGLAIATSFSASAQTRYTMPLDASSNNLWSTKSSQISCLLSYTIVGYGRGDFYMNSGRKKVLGFELFPSILLDADSTMRFIAGSPQWRPSGTETEIGRIKVYRGFNPFVGNTVSWRMLTNLDAGKEILMPYIDKSRGDTENIIPSLSPIGFKKAYDEFVSCQQNLLDIGYQDVQITISRFDASKNSIAPQNTKQLEEQIKYIKQDEAVNKVLIKVYTFGEKNNDANKLLGEKRIDTIVKYYTERGINKDMLETHNIYKETLSSTTRTTGEAEKVESRTVVIELLRDPNKVQYDLEINMPDVGV